MGDFRQKAICTFLFLFQFILLSTDKWRTKRTRVILLIIIITITTSQKQYKTDKQFPLKKNRKLYLLNQTVTLPMTFSDYNGYWTTADAQNHRLPVRGLFNLQAGHVTDWTTRGLDRSWTSQVVNQDNSRVGRLVDITATSFHNLV